MQTVETMAHVKRKKRKTSQQRHAADFRKRQKDLGLSELRNVECYSEDKKAVETLIDTLNALREAQGQTDVLMRIDNHTDKRIVVEYGVQVYIDGKLQTIPGSDEGIAPGKSFIFRQSQYEEMV